jgi:methylated-DNA-[protein]-cysteine S-methyltransferase
MRETIFQTDWGWVGLAATEQGVAAVVLPRPTRRAVERELHGLTGNVGAGFIPARLKREWVNPSPTNGSGGNTAGHLKAAREAITAYLEGNTRVLSLPLDLDGHPSFRVKVWKVLQSIPYGRVRSYSWVARKVGKPRAARAIGGACGANPVPLLVPCHRVIAGDGSLGGFSGGVGVKKRLLKLEGVI